LFKLKRHPRRFEIFNLTSRLIVIRKKIRNRIPEGLIDFGQRKVLPYVAIIIIALFTMIADLAKAQEHNVIYTPSEDVMDLSPAEVAKVTSIIGPYTAEIDEDPVSVALAIENKDYLGKPVISATEITERPKSDEKRTKTIIYTVEGGDTLSKIAWDYSLKIATIKVANGLSSDMIKPGQTLKLPPQDLDPGTIASLKTKTVAGVAIKPFKGTFRSPTSGWRLTQGFGRTGFERFHDGIDLDWGSGTTLYAAASGRVVRATRGWGGGYGTHIVIDHGDGFQTLYGHMSSYSVGVGQWVNQGQVIGVMGNTGWSTGVHVHFKITKNGTPVNPLDYL